MGFKLFVLLSFVAIAGSAALAADAASGARYTVAQCGWHVGQDATWLETSADKFTSSTYCKTPDNADPFENVHLNSSTRRSTSTVSGTRFARWRWSAPAGTGIVTVHGQRWQVLGDNFEHRLGGFTNGGFSPFLQLSSTDTVRRDFSQAFSPYADAFESRLLCAMPEERFCSPAAERSAGVRGLTITLEDASSPVTWIGGPASGAGWMRGTQTIGFGATDTGSGLRYSRTLIDGATGPQTEHPCDKELIAGQWRAVKMLPCRLSALGAHQIDTTRLSDGPHQVRQCAVDFAGNTGCAADSTLRTDNNAPAGPKAMAVTGGEGWHRSNGFNVEWTVPDQGVAAPVVASYYRVTGKDFDSGPLINYSAGKVEGILVPRAGEYRVSVWLVDAAGNTNEASASSSILRLDDVPPSGYLIDPPEDDPELVRASVSDLHSGVASAAISVKRIEGGDWIGLPTEASGAGEVSARFPSDDLERGTYSVRLNVLDHAGNEFTTDRRGNGSPLVLRAPIKDEVGLSAWLEGWAGEGGQASGRGRVTRGMSIMVPFDNQVDLKGRLVNDEGDPLAGQEIEVLENPAQGSAGHSTVRRAVTGRTGYWSLPMLPGPSRQIYVGFKGTRRLAEAAFGPLELKVGGRLTLVAKPRRLRNGGRVHFRGVVDIRSMRRPARSGLVSIQYFEKRARKWRPVLVTWTDGLGRFRASYRFRYITGSTRIRLRAKLLPSAEFPYAGAMSKPVVIRVRP